MSMMLQPHRFGVPFIPWSGPPGMIGQAFSSSGGSGSISASYPSGFQVDDIAILQVISFNAALTAHTINTPAGWTEITQNQLATIAGFRHGIYYRRLTGGESGAVSVTASVTPGGSDCFVADMSVWRGCIASGTPYEALANNTAQSTAQAGSAVTTTGINRTVLNVCANHQIATSTPASGWTEHYEFTTTEGNDGGLRIYSKEAPAATTVAAATHTLDVSKRWQVASFALLPA